jgi:hypothetical protein
MESEWGRGLAKLREVLLGVDRCGLGIDPPKVLAYAPPAIAPTKGALLRQVDGVPGGPRLADQVCLDQRPGR